MDSNFYNIMWSITSGYWYWVWILGIFVWSLSTTIIVFNVDFSYVDITDDIVLPIFLSLLMSVVIGLAWPVCLLLILLMAINLTLIATVTKIIVPIYKFIKDIPNMDFRKGEDVAV